MEIATALLSVLATHAPVYLTLLAAIVFAIVRWQRHPRVSLMAVLGTSSFLLLSMAGAAVSVWLPLHLRVTRGMSTLQMGQVMALWSIATSFVQAGSWVLVILAMFGWRPAKSSQDDVA
ncbi:MAG: hypothetical protein HY898_04145 [Deltaproteobacteria bacterium]|nr:hypothetical protein [Deltaproteobacteria bacterium]